jgi:nucleoside-diphosphate-sugar epimerase
MSPTTILPSLVLTGASGFVGRHLLEELKETHRIFAIARRSQHDCGAAVHPNIAWMRVDLGDREGLARTFREINTAGGADTLVHLAAYYDFTGEPHPEYARTNVEGTRNLIGVTRGSRVGRLVFASSVAACSFPRSEGPVSEATPPDGDHVYAWSKREGEAMVRACAPVLPSAIVRLGAIYSDWCEYPPLYVFLSTWLGSSWRSRVLAGRGRMGIPYIHVRDLVAFFRRLLECQLALEPAEVLLASTAGDTPLARLFELATRSYYGRARRPLFVPAWAGGAGLLAMDLWGRIRGRRPFERSWMRHYVDRRLQVNNSRTCARLGWSPSPRYQIERRLPFVIERLKSEPFEWLARNTAVLRREVLRPDLRVYQALLEGEDQVVGRASARIDAERAGPAFQGFCAMPRAEVEWFVRLLYRLLLNSVQNSNRMLILNYLEVTGPSRFSAGFTSDEICLALSALNEAVLEWLVEREDLVGFRREIHERVTVPIELGMDEVREQYERFLRTPGPAREGAEPVPAGRSSRELLEETIWKCLVQRR